VSISEISVQELAALGPSVRLVDVRELDEWNEVHIAHAVHVPLGTVPDHVEQFDGHPTYVVCRSGARSMRACEYLHDTHGLDVVNVAGGTLAWIDAGNPVASGDAATGADGA
jgi:rhodanese-related sulfurtransferase